MNKYHIVVETERVIEEDMFDQWVDYMSNAMGWKFPPNVKKGTDRKAEVMRTNDGGVESVTRVHVRRVQ